MSNVIQLESVQKAKVDLQKEQARINALSFDQSFCELRSILLSEWAQKLAGIVDCQSRILAVLPSSHGKKAIETNLHEIKGSVEGLVRSLKVGPETVA